MKFKGLFKSYDKLQEDDYKRFKEIVIKGKIPLLFIFTCLMVMDLYFLFYAKEGLGYQQLHLSLNILWRRVFELMSISLFISYIGFFSITVEVLLFLTCLIIYVVVFIYFYAFNDIPSIYTLQLTGQISDIKYAVYDVLTFHHFLLFVISSILALILFIIRHRTNQYFFGSSFKPTNLKDPLKKMFLTIYGIVLVFMCFDYVVMPFSYKLAKDRFNMYQYGPKTSVVYYGVLGNFINEIGYMLFSELHLKPLYDKQQAEDIKSYYQNFCKTVISKKTLPVKNPNIIFIQLESFTSLAKGHYPSLMSLTKKGFKYFPHGKTAIAQGGSSDSEFSVITGLYPFGEGATYTRFPFVPMEGNLVERLNKKGYETIFIHGNDKNFWRMGDNVKKFGFKKTYFYKDGLKRVEEEQVTELGFEGIDDLPMFKQAVSIIDNTTKPFFVHIVTLTSHNPFLLRNSKCKEGDVMCHYLETVEYTDKAVKWFIDTLTKKGLLKDSIVVIYADHNLIVHHWDEELKDYVKGDDSLLYKTPLFIRLPDNQIIPDNVTNKVWSQPDITATIVALLDEDGYTCKDNMVGVPLFLDKSIMDFDVSKIRKYSKMVIFDRYLKYKEGRK